MAVFLSSFDRFLVMHVASAFLAMKFFLSQDRLSLAKSHDYENLGNEYTKWLQRHLTV